VRNIFLFIRRFFILFTFLVLQGFSWAFLVKFNATHEAIFANTSNEITGKVETQYNKVQYYLNLRETNKQLAEENAALRNQLPISLFTPDTTTTLRIDTVKIDSSTIINKYTWLTAKVVNSSITEENNYITLHRGTLQGVNKDMGVVGANGSVVGKVILVSDNYCRVMSLLNRQSKVSAMLKKDNYTGIVDWDGADASTVLLHNISKSTVVKNGDTVITSNLSGNFPAGLLIGTVKEVASEKGSNFYTLKVKTATSFFNLQYAYLINNNLLEEQRKLELQTPKNQ